MFDVAKALRYARRHPLPLWAGFGCVGVLQLARVCERNVANSEGREPVPVRVKAYKALPLRAFSRWWGRLHERELPEWARPALLGLYVRAFGCRMADAVEEDLAKYRNLGELFRRRLKPGARPVDRDPGCCLVSPCDGRVSHVGPVVGSRLEPVKGVSYPIADFLGHDVGKKGSKLYQCVLYLAPGDYHGFHSPTDWSIAQRHHFDGLLLSVNPRALSIDRLFSTNERVVYLGKWGAALDRFFAFAAVGATNVGCIDVPADPALRTNDPAARLRGPLAEPKTEHFSLLKVGRGDFFGEFRLGSSLVLIFECSEDEEIIFNVKSGDTIRVGQRLATSRSKDKSKSQ